MLICFHLNTFYAFTLKSSNHNSVLSVRLVHLANSVDQASVSEGEVLLLGEVPVLLHGGAHDLLETGVDDVKFGGTLDLFTFLLFVTHDFEQAHLGLLLVLLGHLTGGDVFEVLEPLEVGAGDTTTVDQKIGGADDASLDEDLFSSVGGGTVGTLEDSLDFDITSVSFVE